MISGDTLRTVVRNLSSGQLAMESGPAGDEGGSIAFGDVDAYQPGRSSLEFALGSGVDRVEVRVLIGTMRFAERGTVRVSAQAIVRQSR